MARVTIAGVTVAAVLAFPGTALADATIHAVDGTAANGGVNSWSPSEVTIQAGESVTWSFDGTSSATTSSPTRAAGRSRTKLPPATAR